MIPDWPVERKQMVERQLRGRGIRDERVLQAALEIPREEFVPLESRVLSYRDDPVATELLPEIAFLDGTRRLDDEGFRQNLRMLG